METTKWRPGVDVLVAKKLKELVMGARGQIVTINQTRIAREVDPYRAETLSKHLSSVFRELARRGLIGEIRKSGRSRFYLVRGSALWRLIEELSPEEIAAALKEIVTSGNIDEWVRYVESGKKPIEETVAEAAQPAAPEPEEVPTAPEVRSEAFFPVAGGGYG